MGGDQLVPALVGERVDAERGEAIRDSRDELYEELVDEVAPLEGAGKLRDAGAAAVYASVAELRRHLDEAPFV